MKMIFTKVMLDFLKTLLLWQLISATNASQSRHTRSAVNCGVTHNVQGQVFGGEETGRYEHPWCVTIEFELILYI